MEVKDVLLKHVCPGVGVLIAFILFSSPMRAVLAANRAKSLGELNALPFVAMSVNCCCWIIYAFPMRDFYIFIGNVPGMMLGLFYVLTCFKFSKEPAQDMLRNLLLFGVGFVYVCGLISLAGNFSAAQAKTLWGAACVAILSVYYVAPLSTVAKVIMERDSSSLFAPLSLMNVINGLLWFAYGLAIGPDYFVAMPNGIGAAFNMVCLAFCFIFPAKRRAGAPLPADAALNPAANWGGVRLQSIARRPGDAAAAAASGGRFFDLTQLRWRASSAPGGTSFLRLLSSGRLSNRLSSRLGSGGADAAAATASDQPPAPAQQPVPVPHAGKAAAKQAVGAGSSDVLASARACDALEHGSDAGASSGGLIGTAGDPDRV